MSDAETSTSPPLSSGRRCGWPVDLCRRCRCAWRRSPLAGIAGHLLPSPVPQRRLARTQRQPPGAAVGAHQRPAWRRPFSRHGNERCGDRTDLLGRHVDVLRWSSAGHDEVAPIAPAAEQVGDMRGPWHRSRSLAWAMVSLHSSSPRDRATSSSHFPFSIRRTGLSKAVLVPLA